jgi:hypothetical protein
MDAAAIMRIRDLLPTGLGSAEIREQFAADILRRSVFSARMEDLRHLATIRDVCADIVGGTINQATARERLLASLARMGHSPQDGAGIENPASIRRLDLIIDTQRQMAASAAKIAAETESTLEEWPAVELTRFAGRAAPRADWMERWHAAGEAVGWQGASREAGGYPDWRMVALKASPIWQALGDGAGGYRDTLGNPFPPFAYGSGLAWADVDREEAVRLGLIGDDENAPAPARPDLSPTDAEIASAVSRLGFDDLFNDIAG